MLESKEKGNSEKKTKRRRVSLACEGCRQRKTRCDGVQPTCGICVRRNMPCVYKKRYIRAHVSVEYVKQLEEKLGILSDENAFKSSDLDRSLSVTCARSINEDKQDESDQIERLSRTLDNSDSNFQIITKYTDASYENPKAPNSDVFEAQPDRVLSEVHFKDEYSTTDAMGAGSATALKDNRDKSFYGRSAAMSFMKELFASVDDNKYGEKEELTLTKKYKYRMSRYDISKYGSLDNIVLPTRSVANKYVKNYFEYAYPLYPFIHKPTFMSAYEEIWSGESSGGIDELFFCIVNIVFAFGYRLSPTEVMSETSDNANVYFERSQELLRFHLMDTGSLLLIQALLLTGQFLQATSRLAGCWNIIGLAIRIAQGLGLHTVHDFSPRRSYIKQEIEKRLWHGCLLMDKIVSITFGRPLMVIEDQTLEKPSYIDDEFVTDEAIKGRLPTQRPSVLSFFSETVKLYDILADILKLFYTDSGPDTVDLLVCIFKLQERLYDFQDSIPRHIKFGSCLREPPYQRQSIVLEIRYLHLKIMLYRPVLFPKDRDQVRGQGINRTELYLSSHKSISSLCLETAMELVQLISRFRSADITLLPAIWYCIFYVYTAGSVLLAAKLQPCLQDDLDKIKFESSWKMMVELLESYKSQSESAGKCLKVLEMMNEKIIFTSQTRANRRYDGSDEEHSNTSDSEVPSDLLYSLMYDTTGPFGGPFFYSNEYD